MSNPDNLRVHLDVDNVIGDINLEAYLTDEGLCVDVYQGDECIASGYEFFSEVGLTPPKPLQELKNDSR